MVTTRSNSPSRALPREPVRRSPRSLTAGLGPARHRRPRSTAGPRPGCGSSGDPGSDFGAGTSGSGLLGGLPRSAGPASAAPGRPGRESTARGRVGSAVRLAPGAGLRKYSASSALRSRGRTPAGRWLQKRAMAEVDGVVDDGVDVAGLDTVPWSPEDDDAVPGRPRPCAGRRCPCRPCRRASAPPCRPRTTRPCRSSGRLVGVLAGVLLGLRAGGSAAAMTTAIRIIFISFSSVVSVVGIPSCPRGPPRWSGRGRTRGDDSVAVVSRWRAGGGPPRRSSRTTTGRR